MFVIIKKGEIVNSSAIRWEPSGYDVDAEDFQQALKPVTAV